MEKEKKEESSTKKMGKLLIKVALSAIAIYLILRKVNLENVGAYFKTLDVLFASLAILTFFVSKLVSAVRLNAYYTTQSILIDEKTNAKLYFNSMFYNLFIPLVGGEAYKVLWLKNNYKADYKSLIWSALLDRGSGLAALVVLSIISFNSYNNGYAWDKFTWALIPIVILGSWLVHKLFFKSWIPAFSKTTILSFIVQVLQVVTIYFIICALGIEEKILEYIFIFLMSSFAYILPFIGARELAFVYGAEYLQLNIDVSLSLSVLFYLVIAINSLLGAIFFFIPIKPKLDVTD